MALVERQPKGSELVPMGYSDRESEASQSRLLVAQPRSLRHKELQFDARYGWTYDDFFDPNELSLAGGRGRFAIVPLMAASFHLAVAMIATVERTSCTYTIRGAKHTRKAAIAATSAGRGLVSGGLHTLRPHRPSLPDKPAQKQGPRGVQKALVAPPLSDAVLGTGVGRGTEEVWGVNRFGQKTERKGIADQGQERVSESDQVSAERLGGEREAESAARGKERDRLRVDSGVRLATDGKHNTCAEGIEHGDVNARAGLSKLSGEGELRKETETEVEEGNVLLELVEERSTSERRKVVNMDTEPVSGVSKEPVSGALKEPVSGVSEEREVGVQVAVQAERGTLSGGSIQSVPGVVSTSHQEEGVSFLAGNVREDQRDASSSALEVTPSASAQGRGASEENADQDVSQNSPLLRRGGERDRTLKHGADRELVDGEERPVRLRARGVLEKPLTLWRAPDVVEGQSTSLASRPLFVMEMRRSEGEYGETWNEGRHMLEVEKRRLQSQLGKRLRASGVVLHRFRGNESSERPDLSAHS